VEDLSRANSDLNNLMGSTDIGTVFLDRELRIVRFTPSAQTVFNLLPTDLGRPIGDITHRLQHEGLISDAEQVLASLKTIEREVQLDEKGRRWFLVRIAPYRTPEDRIAGVVATFIDITQRKTAQEQLRESEARFRAMFMQASVGIVQIGDGGQFLTANPGFCQIVGYTEQELSTMRVADVTHPEDYPREEELTRQLVSGEVPDFILEKRYRKKDGSIVWGTMTTTFVRQASGAPLYTLAIVQAIGDRKEAEERLRASEERFRTVADNVPQLIWTNDAKGDANYFNRRWYEYSGLSHEQSYGLGWQAMVHPDDAPASVARWEKAFAAGEVFDAEYRLRRADGAYRWFLGRNVPLRTDGTILSWFGTATDIDDYKQAQTKLRETEEKFRLLVEGTPDYAMFLLDQDNNITYWSAGAQRVFQWTSEEAIGQKGSMIFTPEDLEKGEDQKEIAQSMEQGSAPDRRWHIRKDGTRMWLDGFMRRLDDPQTGALRGFAKIAREATEQKMAEEKLREAYEEMEQRVHHRTKELQAMNESLEQEMTGRQQLEKELLEISEREKRRIGEDLHDMICQELTATALFLKSSAKQLGDGNPVAVAKLDEAAHIVNQNVGTTRDLARGLQPAELAGGGLRQALRALADQACENTGMKCHVKFARGVRVADETIGLHVYRIAQEAVKNAIKHSGAKNLLITLDKNKDHVCISVEDDGKGFTPSKRSKGLGLHIMRYRANALGGELKIERRTRGGTEIRCKIPLKR
jgi:PAS domain S-box-containing protein